jgi:hypothetical protein
LCQPLVNSSCQLIVALPLLVLSLHPTPQVVELPTSSCHGVPTSKILQPRWKLL